MIVDDADLDPCDREPHYKCSECGSDEFIVVYTDAERTTTWQLGEDHRMTEKIDSQETIGFSHERGWYVRCAHCDREIKFGWSHPERGGRIWPVEAACYNPWKSWPEARYRKGWPPRPGVKLASSGGP